MQELRLSDHELDELLSSTSNQFNLRIDLDQIPTGASRARTDSTVSSVASSAPSSPSMSPRSDIIPLAEGVVPKRCGYRTGKCQNMQAVKRNGKLHKLCEFHREKANQNQKKLDRKKRLQRYAPYEASFPEGSKSFAPEVYGSSPRSIGDADAYTPHPTSLHEAPQDLGCEELAIFCNLMMSDLAQHAVPMSTRPVFSHHLVQHHHAQHHHHHHSMQVFQAHTV
ncbi:hypothetical protein P43SY_009692 [Pythium insidiosum]|uniref:Uncharacterized protein n=1 Tax=Pythium insidiosum TaxID=114742 RepID=A0AAD5LEI5_PYTIN|nr:hypothetical protein P43SY_009692 [Pythium insidiosum]